MLEKYVNSILQFMQKFIQEHPVVGVIIIALLLMCVCLGSLKVGRYIGAFIYYVTN